MSAAVRVGQLSFAHHHGHAWARALRQSDRAEFVGVWDDDAPRGREAADAYDVPFVAELGELLGACDAVGITSETSAHVRLIEAATDAGTAILCEKPLGLSRDDCVAIEWAVESSGVYFMQNLPKRYDPAHRALAELVTTGALGEPIAVRMRHGNFHFLDGSAAGTWFMDPERSGRGGLLDEGIHAVDYLSWLLGTPQTASAALSVPDGSTSDQVGVAVYTFADGGIAELTTGGALWAGEGSIEVHGTEGSAVLGGIDLTSSDFAPRPAVRLYRRGRDRGQWETLDEPSRFGTEHYHEQGFHVFLKHMQSEREPIVGLFEARRAMEMVFAAYESADSGEHVAVPAPWGAS